MIAVSPNQTDIETALGDFLTGILSGIEVIVGQVNRAPEPSAADFIVMWPILRARIETNIDSSVDTLFTASIAANVMTVTAVNYGDIEIGDSVFGVNVADGTSIVSLGTGTGGVGTYNLSNSQSVGSEAMASGVTDILQPTEVTMQLDVHGPISADNAQIISTLFRDTYGVEAFLALNANITPLYTDDPRQVPFINAQQQYEDRWVLDIHLQVNQSVVVPQQFADVVSVDVINVEATYS